MPSAAYYVDISNPAGAGLPDVAPVGVWGSCHELRVLLLLEAFNGTE
jgi:hypothetical protein